MAQRRMFSLKIVDTDAFLEMPQSSQLLYYHLAMRADDDGFVSNPKKIMKMVGSNEDDYKVLLSKRYLISFESGVCIIKHWLVHNLIRHDRYNETTYKLEKSKLSLNEYGAYTEKDGDVIPNGNQMAPQVRLGKVNTSVADAPQEFNWEKYLEGMLNHNRKDLNIIGFYFKAKNKGFDTKAKAEVAIKRHLKPAQTLKVFDKNEIGETIRKLAYDFPKFTLETVIKELTK